jgi:hypothetical protein
MRDSLACILLFPFLSKLSISQRMLLVILCPVLWSTRFPVVFRETLRDGTTDFQHQKIQIRRASVSCTVWTGYYLPVLIICVSLTSSGLLPYEEILLYTFLYKLSKKEWSTSKCLYLQANCTDSMTLVKHRSFLFILSKIIRVKINETVILPVVLCECKIWALT